MEAHEDHMMSTRQLLGQNKKICCQFCFSCCVGTPYSHRYTAESLYRDGALDIHSFLFLLCRVLVCLANN